MNTSYLVLSSVDLDQITPLNLLLLPTFGSKAIYLGFPKDQFSVPLMFVFVFSQRFN